VTTKSPIDANAHDECEADRRFLQELSKIERERLAAALEVEEAEKAPVPAKASALLEQLTDLATRVRVLESVCELALENRVFGAVELRAAGRIDVSDLDADCEFTDTPESIDDRQFFWTQSERLEFDLPVQRLRTRFLRIRFASIIKTEYARQAMLSIDGAPVRHWVGRSKSDHFFECAMPVLEDFVPSRISLAIPAVHAPSELGLSDDDRRIGIALIGVEFSSRPESGWLQRLRAGLRSSGSRS